MPVWQSGMSRSSLAMEAEVIEMDGDVNANTCQYLK